MKSQSRSASIRRRRLGTWWGKRRIDALEILGPKAGPEPRRRHLARVERAAAEAVTPLRRWKGISARSYETYTNGPNVVRLQRLVELIPERTRILDVGIGFGYVSGILMRECNAAYYCGVDLRQTYLDATTSMLEANDLSPDSVVLEILDVYDVTAELLDRHSPELILLLEVLEHVPNPAEALRIVSAAAKTGTQLLFTVPLFGRLEGVWGHLSMFDRGRLEEICSSAGLRIDRAEPVANHWAMVVATVERRPPGRGGTSDSDAAYSFEALATDGAPDDYRRPADDAEVALTPRRAYIECAVSVPADHAEPAAGGLRFAVRDPTVLRLELELEPPTGARWLEVRGTTATGEVRVSWVAGKSRRPVEGQRTTFVLKPGRRSKSLGPVEVDPAGVRWIEVVVGVAPGERIELKLYRAAWISDPPGDSRIKRALRARFVAD